MWASENRTFANLQNRVSDAVAGDRLEDRRQDGVDRRVDGATEAICQQVIGDRGNDEMCSLDPDLLKRLIEGIGTSAVDDLGGLHDLARGNVEPGHISHNVSITDYREKLSHRDDWMMAKWPEM